MSTPRPILPDSARTPQAADATANFHRNIVDAVREAVAHNPVVVVGMAQNPWVKKARTLLDEAGVRYTYLEYGSYFSQWKERLAIKMWSGWPTFPQVFVRGTLIGGHDDTKRLLADGSFQNLLSQSQAPEA